MSVSDHGGRSARPRKVRVVPAARALSSADNVERINELRMIRFPAPTGKVGRPRHRRDYLGVM